MAEKPSKEQTKSYADSHYLLFGAAPGSSEADTLDCQSAKDYLSSIGFDGGSLAQARNLRGEALDYVDLTELVADRCDFCGRRLSGVEYDRLKDGRERCASCSKTLVNSPEAFQQVFLQVKQDMCGYFNIDFPPAIQAKMVSQSKLSRMIGRKFVPGPGYDARAVGFATERRGRYMVVFENGVPKVKLQSTLAHELTHIWQYSHWNMDKVKSRYGDTFLAVVEGMAEWVEIQYLLSLGEVSWANRLLKEEVARTDVYGFGLRLYLNEYPLARGTMAGDSTPFQNLACPVDGL